jgi:riboflavin kinase / FMN adenylyltransferase
MTGPMPEPGGRDAAVTIGKFDGVHLGHRAVIDRLRDEAAARGLLPTVVTFDRNPLAVLAPERCPAPLVSSRQKRELLEAEGVERVVELVFDLELSRVSPEEFVRRALVDGLRTRLVLVGEDFRFGARGAGDVARLRELGAEHGFEVIAIGDVTGAAGARVSSTAIRTALDEGRLDDAATMLGRPHAIRSTVVHGEARGRELGYPTANLSPAIEGYVPADGVYAVRAVVDGVAYGAEASIGNNPTFENVPQHQVEVHLFDQRIDLYDRELTVEFVRFIRPMRAFDSIESLVVQLQADDDRIREILGLPPRPGAAIEPA